MVSAGVLLVLGVVVWLRGLEGDGGADQVEGAALIGGSVGEFVDFDVGAGVADAVAGQGR